MITVERHSSDDEMTIIAFMIMNDDVAMSCYRRYTANELKTKHFGEYFRPLFRSLISYIGKFSSAPRFTIEKLYEKMRIDPDSKSIIGEYLERIAEQYEQIVERQSADPTYVILEVVPNFIREQEGKLLVERIEQAIDQGRHSDIDEAIEEFKHIEDEDNADISFGTTTPFSAQAVENFYSTDAIDKSIMRLPGAISGVVPPIVRKKLYAITGVEKAGKTSWIGEIIYRAVVLERAKVLWINCEMDDEDLSEFFWRRFTKTASDKEHSGRVVYPVFDCLNNQLDRCEILDKSLNGDRLYETGRLAYYPRNKGWKVCTKCRNDRTRFQKPTKIYIPAIWFEQDRVRQLRRGTIARAIKLNRTLKLGRLRTKTFPRLSVKLTDVERYVRTYCARNKFNPDILVLDYPDIIAPEEGKLLDRQNVDYIWKKCAGLTHELGTATIVADQATKAARSKRSIERDDTSEAKTKDAHLDVRITLNMNDEEEELGVQRVGILYRRKGKRTTSQVMVTQRRETGEMLLDSEWWFGKDTSYMIRKK
jgi:hypothetical protein